MSTTLPELPEARIESYQTDGTMRTTKLTTYDEFDMHAYGLAVWKAGIEAAAKEAEARSASVQKSNTYRGRVNAAAMFAAGQLEFLASDLRALPLPELAGSPQERRE